ncbi:redoxin family protein [Sphingobacterium corticis]|uniref:Redoxin family protein n=1 Tax=Sphingobacterium corticis TaxID=1812823 RepID=A0ABW5NIX1_9SPHI
MTKFKIARLIFIKLLCVVSAHSYSQENISIKQLEQNLDSLDLHMIFLEESDLSIDSLISQYEVWRLKFPHSSTVPLALGRSLFYRSHSDARKWLTYALQNDSALAEAHMLYGMDAERWGDNKVASEAFSKASRIEKGNARYAFYEAHSYANYDLKTYFDKMNSIPVNYKGDEAAAMALYWLANKSLDTFQKKRYYKQLAKEYPFEKYHFTRSGMNEYFDLLVNEDLKEAIELATSIWKQQADSTWFIRLESAQLLYSAKNQYSSAQYDSVLYSIKSLETSRYSSISRATTLLVADTFVKLSDFKSALQALTTYFVQNPDTSVYKRIEKIGFNNGMEKFQIRDLVKTTILEEADNASEIKATSYIDQSEIKLSDFYGKTVLLSFWFPTCGPCRAEFPHIEYVLNNRKERDVVYLGINMVHEQDDYVLPFLEKAKTSFIPLKDNPEERGNLIAEAAPSNYLIDKSGKIVFKDFLVNSNNRNVLELMLWIIE